MTNKPTKLGEVLKSAADYLNGKGLENPRLLCEILASRLLDCKKLELPLQYDLELNEKQLHAMRRGVTRLENGEPVQYIVGQTEFMGHLIKTDKRALIPRPETESLVELMINDSGLWQNDKTAIAEVGTGTGCITISLALAKPEALFLAIDISSEAIDLAKENAAFHDLNKNVAFANAELSDLVDPESLDAIVANLPYIATAEYEQLPREILEHEPRTALDGGPDGLSVIEPIVQDASFALKQNGRIYLEIGETQADAVSQILAETGFGTIKVHQDLTGRNRFVSATLEMQ